jgi:hypothetical protein
MSFAREPRLDHHHLARALFEEGINDVAVTGVSGLKPSAFRVYLDNRSWMHLYAANGGRQNQQKFPRHVEAALQESLRLAKGQNAAYLPGWCGAVDAG